MYGIEISYSWGDCEDDLYGNFKTEEDAFKEMCVLAAKEAYVQNEEFEEDKTCTVYFDAAEKTIDLHYECDDTWCFYRIKNKEDVEAKSKQWKPNIRERILIEKIEEAKKYCKGELELDLFYNDMFGDGWYAMDYIESSGGAFPINSYEKPLIKIQTVRKYDIDVRKCCDYCGVAYVG